MPESTVGQLITATLAIMGGVAHYLHEVMKNKDKKFELLFFIGHMFIGGFTGLSMAKLAAVLGMNQDSQHLFAAWDGVAHGKRMEG